MNVQTTRFGAVDVDETRIINFRGGLLGFSSFKRFTLLQPDDEGLFFWLQDGTGVAVAAEQRELEGIEFAAGGPFPEVGEQIGVVKGEVGSREGSQAPRRQPAGQAGGFDQDRPGPHHRVE